LKATTFNLVLVKSSVLLAMTSQRFSEALWSFFNIPFFHTTPLITVFGSCLRVEG